MTSERAETRLSQDHDESRPRVLGIRFGVNPNSSSLGVDVTFLLFGGMFAVAAAIVLGALLRGRRKMVEPYGETKAPAAEPASKAAQ